MGTDDSRSASGKFLLLNSWREGWRTVVVPGARSGSYDIALVLDGGYSREGASAMLDHWLDVAKDEIPDRPRVSRQEMWAQAHTAASRTPRADGCAIWEETLPKDEYSAPFTCRDRIAALDRQLEQARSAVRRLISERTQGLELDTSIEDLCEALGMGAS